jgi:hypothetical protein
VDISKKLPNITLIIKSEELLDKSDYTLLKKRIEKDLKTRVVLNISSKP